jgi:hypothetical protein
MILYSSGTLVALSKAKDDGRDDDPLIILNFNRKSDFNAIHGN